MELFTVLSNFGTCTFRLYPVTFIPVYSDYTIANMARIPCPPSNHSELYRQQQCQPFFINMLIYGQIIQKIFIL